MTKSFHALPALVFATFLAGVLAGCASSGSPAPVEQRGGAARSAAPAASANSGEFYTVRKGDTLYAIASSHGQSFRDIASWNNLQDPHHIEVGQQLRVKPPKDDGVAKPMPVGSQVVEKRSLEGASATPAAAASGDGVKREPKAGKEAYSDQAYAKYQGGSGATKASKAPATPAKAEEGASGVAASGLAWGWPASGKVLSGFGHSGGKGLEISGRTGDPVYAAADGKVVYAGSGLPSYGKLVIVKHNASFLSVYAHNSTILVKEGQQVSRGQKVAEIGSTGADGVKLHFEIRRQGNPVDPLQYLPKR